MMKPRNTYFVFLDRVALGVLSVCLMTTISIAQTSDAVPDATPTDVDAPQAVRRGNDLLTHGDASAALQAYDRAKELRPDAREIAFVQGLAHFDLGDYEKAREAFLQAAATANDELADDARYGLATCDHVEALQSKEDPQKSVSQLEDAMRQYQNVLANRPDHKLARESNFKAASMWRQIKQMMQEQQQQQQQEGDEKKEDQENKDQQEKNEQKSEDQEKQDHQDQQQSQDQQEKDQQQQQSDQSNEDQQQQEQQQQQQQSEAQKQEQVSKEQAERKLREMMQELRDRQKKRRQPVRPVPGRPVEKDW